VDIQIRCSKGTYIRQLAHDLGEDLGCGAHVTRLRRLASGPFALEQAASLEELNAEASDRRWLSRLITMNGALAHLPVIQVNDAQLLRALCQGKIDSDWEHQHLYPLDPESGPVRIVSAEDRLVALWRNIKQQRDGRAQRRLRVFG
jgi:tRNA pseudouridine55 synthase